MFNRRTKPYFSAGWFQDKIYVAECSNRLCPAQNEKNAKTKFDTTQIILIRQDDLAAVRMIIPKKQIILA